MDNNREPYILAFIPARGGSKGVPGKALKDLGGRSLISYTIRDAQRIRGNVRVFVSTDDAKIRVESLAHGADVPFLRPEYLARDDSRLEDALQYSLDRLHVEEGYEPDILIVMSPTYPFRKPNRINDALDLGYEHTSLFNIGSVASAHADIGNMFEIEDSGLKRIDCDLPFDLAREQLVQSSLSFNIVFQHRHMESRERVPIVLDGIETIDIDEPTDLLMARQVIEEGLYPF